MPHVGQGRARLPLLHSLLGLKGGGEAEGGEVGGGEGEGGKVRGGMCHWKGVKGVGEGREKQDLRLVGGDGWLVGGEGREKEVGRVFGIDVRPNGGEGRE